LKKGCGVVKDALTSIDYIFDRQQSTEQRQWRFHETFAQQIGGDVHSLKRMRYRMTLHKGSAVVDNSYASAASSAAAAIV